MVPVTREFPVEDFFKVPFTHHVEKYKQTDLSARYYYIHRTTKSSQLFPGDDTELTKNIYHYE